jgi:hypothetical protein
MKLRYQLIALGAVASLGSGAALAATSQHGRYLAVSVTEPATAGVPANKPLEGYVRVSKARVVVPAEWTRLSAKPGQLRFLTPGQSCRYRVTLAVSSRRAPDGAGSDYVAAGLPAPGPQYVLAEGPRRSGAFRVIREKGTGSVVRLRALWAAVVGRRVGLAPGQGVVWTELSVSAASRKGDECHAGTWRERMGPQIGDALAGTHAQLAFARKPS